MRLRRQCTRAQNGDARLDRDDNVHVVGLRVDVNRLVDVLGHRIKVTQCGQRVPHFKLRSCAIASASARARMNANTL